MAEAEAPRGAAPFSMVERRIALRYLRARRRHGGIALIAIISFTGIMLGVAALITIMSIMNGFRHELLSHLLGVQSHIYVDVRGMDRDDVYRLADRIADLPGVENAGPRLNGQALASAGGRTLGAQVVGVRREDLAQIDRIVGAPDRDRRGTGLQHGTFDGFGVEAEDGDHILIGQGLAIQLGVVAGEEVTLIGAAGVATPFGGLPRRKAYVAGGIFSVGVYEYDQIFVFMPIEEAVRFFRLDGPQNIEVRAADPDAIDPLIAEISRMAGPGVVIYDWREQNRSFYTALQVERFAMRLILAVVIAIAALNIVTGLIMLVKNKGRDIAILRTMGATQNSVLRIFLMIGLMIGALGAIGGVVLGVLFVVNIGNLQDFIRWATGVDIFPPEVYFLTQLPARLDMGEVINAAIFGLGAALLAAVPPAWRAARIDPVEALRYE